MASKKISKDSSYSERHMETISNHVMKRDRHENRGRVPQISSSHSELQGYIGRDRSFVTVSLITDSSHT